MTEEQILIRIRAIAETGDVKVAAAEVKKLAVELDKVEGAAGKAAGGKRNMGMAALEASRAVEDLQYGVRGILNNIPTLVMSLGGTAGIAAAASLAAVALSQLLPLIGKLGGDSEEAKKHAEATAEALEKLREKAKASKEELAKDLGDEWARGVQRQIDAIDLQSQALQENINLLKARAVAEKALSDAEAALQMARVDLRAKTDPRYSDVQQLQDKAAIEAASRRRLADAQIEEQNRKLQEAMNRVQIADAQAQAASGNAAYFQSEEQATKDRIRALKSELNQAKADVEMAKRLEDESNSRTGAVMMGTGGGGAVLGASNPLLVARAAELRRRAEMVNAPAIEVEIAGLEQQVKEAHSLAKKAVDSMGAASKSLAGAGQALEATQQEVAVAVQNIEAVYKVQSQASGLKTTSAAVGAAVGQMKAVGDQIDQDLQATLKAAGDGEAGLTRSQQRAKEAAEKIRKVTADSVLTLAELNQAQQALANGLGQQAGISKETQSQIRTVLGDLAALKRMVEANSRELTGLRSAIQQP